MKKKTKHYFFYKSQYPKLYLRVIPLEGEESGSFILGLHPHQLRVALGTLTTYSSLSRVLENLQTERRVTQLEGESGKLWGIILNC